MSDLTVSLSAAEAQEPADDVIGPAGAVSGPGGGPGQ